MTLSKLAPVTATISGLTATVQVLLAPSPGHDGNAAPRYCGFIDSLCSAKSGQTKLSRSCTAGRRRAHRLFRGCFHSTANFSVV